ncbi:MAG: gluconokinase [Clostridiales bacterium]|nr:gluconokinase [Clostridiales bacterium]
MNILGLEVSTSAAKAIIYSSKDGVIDVKSITYPEEVCDVISQDVDGMYETLLECVDKILEENKLEIHALSISTTWHSLLLLDENREPIDRLMTWADTEAADTVKEYRSDKEFSSMFYNKTGCVVHSVYPIWKFIHQTRTRQDIVDRVRYISSQQEYVFEKLTGERAVSKTIASGTGFFNINSLDWDDELLDFAGINREQLSPLVEPTYHAPLEEKMASKMGLPANIPVVIGGSDGALNQIGAGAMEEGIMTLSVGTSGALRLASSEPVLPDEPSTWCYYLANGKRIAGAATDGAGNCVEWFVKRLNRDSGHSLAQLDTIAEGVDRGNAPIFLPFIYGERCPGWDDQRLGGFHGIRGSHLIGDMYYALLEGVLFNLYHCYIILAEVMDIPDEIRISGGITNSPIWLQMAADIFQREVVTSEIEHASIIGAVALALDAMDEIESLEDFSPPMGEHVKPNPSMAEFYKARFGKYLETYQSM